MRILNFGSLNIDYVCSVEEMVKPGQTIASTQFVRYPGGKGLNQSLAAARAGAKVCHAGMIGQDGIFLKELLEDSGVDCRHLRVADTCSGSTFIQVDRHGQNSIVLVGGANQSNSKENCDLVLQDFSAGDLLLLQNEINHVDYLIEKAYEKGMQIALNPSPMNEAVRSCDLQKVSLFIMNEDEGMQITGKEAAEEILVAMQETYPRAKVVLTMGKQGAVYQDDTQRLHQPSFPVKTVDTTAAGDTFTGYFLASMVQNEEIADSLRTAAQAAAMAVETEGAASSIPYGKEIAARF